MQNKPPSEESRRSYEKENGFIFSPEKLKKKYGRKVKENSFTMTERKSSLLRQKRWEERCVCLICGATVATAKWHKVARHFSTCHKSFQANYPPCSELRAEKICVLKAALGKEQSFLTRLGKNLKLHLELQMFGLRTRKPFRTGRSWKEQWWLLQIRC